ncbi:hypothetical protein GQX74_002345 [Glossina fuscipes]|nr:hypothetical protein GQX74_002345 [Glossina fuscipes]
MPEQAELAPLTGYKAVVSDCVIASHPGRQAPSQRASHPAMNIIDSNFLKKNINQQQFDAITFKGYHSITAGSSEAKESLESTEEAQRVILHSFQLGPPPADLAALDYCIPQEWSTCVTFTIVNWLTLFRKHFPRSICPRVVKQEQGVGSV